MPEADGGDIASQMRGDSKLQDVPIIFVSAMVSRKESGTGFYVSGGEYFLAKPITVDVLEHAISDVLSKVEG
jgi:CheY-like chemotaxis protein